MRKTLRVIMAIMSVLVAVFAFASLVYRLGEARSSGERSSGAEYSILRNALISMQTKESLQDQFLRNRLIALYKGSERLLAAQVLDESGLVVWKVPSDSAYFALPNTASVRGGFSAPEWSTVVFSTPLSENMKLLALYATVRRSDISSAAALPLIVAAVWCLILAFAILSLRKEDKPSAPADAARVGEVKPLAGDEATTAESFEEAEEIDEEKEPESPEIPEAAAPGSFPEEGSQETSFAEKLPPSAEAERGQGPAAASNRNFEESLAKLEEEITEWSTRHSDWSVQSDQPSRLDQASQSGQPSRQERPKEACPDENGQTRGQESRDGMDDELSEELEELESTAEEEPDSGAEATMEDSRESLQEFEELSAEADGELAASGTRPQTPSAAPQRIQAQTKADISNLPMPLSLSDSTLEARLSEELSRNPKNDVSLMLIHCAVNSPTDPAALALAVTIKDYIGSKDLVFELYKGAFAVVLPSVDLGGTLKMSEDLADVLAATLSLYRDIEGEAPVFIGISSRADRIVDAWKIYREASTAVHKAFAGGHSRILAFRPKSE